MVSLCTELLLQYIYIHFCPLYIYKFKVYINLKLDMSYLLEANGTTQP